MLHAFMIISLVYVGIGVRTLYRVIAHWRELWDDDVTIADLRIARSAAFYLLVPPAVALHELGHAVVVWILGSEVIGWMFLGYMGFVVHPSTGAIGDFAIALAGNAVTLAIGAGALAFGVLRPRHPIRNLLFVELGRQSLFLVLAFYPVLCITFDGDFRTIYNFRATPIASAIVAALNASIIGIGYFWLWKRRWKARSILVTSPRAASFLELEQRIIDNPEDGNAHRELGLLMFAAGDHPRARPHLEKALTLGVVDAHVHMALGTALLENDEAERAIFELETALNGLLRPEDRLLAEIPLIRALATSGRRDDAKARLEILMRAHPRVRALRELADRLR